ncbi:hypothetical protein HOY80DRAFT_1105812 [Tuber brumale]|nr:hypothetical protein HOY80DRAFT_1105812 [Tuber brumale]
MMDADLQLLFNKTVIRPQEDVLESSALRSSLSVIDVDFPTQQDEQEGNLFANDEATDIDKDSEKAPQRHRRVQKRSVEDYSQHQQRAKRLRFLTADSPSPALTGPTSAFSSQSQQAQIHSGHRRVNSLHFTPSILGSQPILTHQNGCQTAEEDNSTSDMVDTVTSLSDRSNLMRGEERIVFENAANMLMGEGSEQAWLVRFGNAEACHDFYEYTIAEGRLLAALSKLIQSLQLKSRQSSARSHLVSETRITVQDFYDLLHKQPVEIRAKVSYLLEDDHFTCHPSKHENWGFRFAAPEIAILFYHKWFRNVKMRGRTDKSFLGLINGVLICLTAALVQKKLVEDTKKRIKRLLPDNGFVQEHESCVALEDLDAAEYLGVQVSGDEQSDVQDNNSDPEAEDVIDALVEGPEEDE